MNGQFSTVGVLGLGAFGQLIAKFMSPQAKVIGFDPQVTTRNKVALSDFASVARADVVFLAIPLEAYGQTLPQLAKVLPNTSLLVDVCSVKVMPEKMIALYLPDHPELLATHPLFGPQRSAKHGVAGQRVVVTTQRGKRAQALLSHFQQRLELIILHCTAEVHDQAMARMQALTFFVARGLGELSFDTATPFTVPSFEMLKELKAFGEAHSDALFETLQNGNPFAAAARQEFIQSLIRVDKLLSAS